MKIGKYSFDFDKKSYIMGILNVTPDSFSDGGSYTEISQALKQAEEMVRQGASIIDVGGESTRPGHEKISAQEEMDRVLPVMEAIRRECDVAISLDTYKYDVAKAGIAAGADMINDIWGLQWDDRLGPLIAETGVACCLMHNHQGEYPGSFEEAYLRDIDEILLRADQAGIPRDRIMLDPGVGFAKSYEENLWVMRELGRLKAWKLPILLGVSRKSVIGLTLKLPVDQRLEGTIASTVLGRQMGASIFRVHDVEANARALKMTDAILGLSR